MLWAIVAAAEIDQRQSQKGKKTSEKLCKFMEVDGWFISLMWNTGTSQRGSSCTWSGNEEEGRGKCWGEEVVVGKGMN